jgi:hopanoid biosynthesis associated protein HpnK
MKHLVVTADDFGLAPEVNDAVETAHRHGILTATSLMVAGPAAQDAVARARRLPRLRVGLHIVLVEGSPMLPAERVSDLIDTQGCFRTDMARLGLDIAMRRSARRQVAAEIEAQFEAFRASGLTLDHVNAHKHFHLHPTIAGEIIAVGARYGLRGLRVPREPASVLSAVEPQAAHTNALLTAPWAALLARRARRAGLQTPDAVFGLAWSGAMTTSRLLGLLQHLPEGRSEIYMHPATADDFAGHAPGYRYAEELKALIAPEVVVAALARPLPAGRASKGDGPYRSQTWGRSSFEARSARASG